MVNSIRLEDCWCAGVVRNVDLALVLVELCYFFLLASPSDTHHFSVREARQRWCMMISRGGRAEDDR